MIPKLASPSVCVIDDDPVDYVPILEALIQIGIGCLHIKGVSQDQLPPAPFKGLRIVFADLHLAGNTGKDAASHAANVFRKVVSPNSGPLLVVIWSKYAGDQMEISDLPEDDQPTEADFFKSAVLEAEPLYEERLIFVKMPKPKPGDRPEDWTSKLKTDIQSALKGYEACEALWCWEALVRDAAVTITEELTSLVVANPTTEPKEFAEDLKVVLQLLAREQGGPDCSADTSARHLVTVLGQSVSDTLEHSDELMCLADHADWIADKKNIPKDHGFAPKLNGVLLTSSAANSGRAFVPGMVYAVTDPEAFKEKFGEKVRDLSGSCFLKLDKRRKNPKPIWTREQWEANTLPVLLEISPVCDFHQSTRKQALLVAGMIGPAEGLIHARGGDGHHILPNFNLRWGFETFAAQDVFLVFSYRYKFSLAYKTEPSFIKPWFRLRDLPTAAVRSGHASHSARIGFVSC